MGAHNMNTKNGQSRWDRYLTEYHRMAPIVKDHDTLCLCEQCQQFQKTITILLWMERVDSDLKWLLDHRLHVDSLRAEGRATIEETAAALAYNDATIVPGLMSRHRYDTTPAHACAMGNDVDSDIFPFLKRLNSFDWMVTTSSCSGHGCAEPYVSVAVKATAMREFVRLLNVLVVQYLDYGDSGFSLECGFDHDVACATSCDFENFPEWLMFELSFHRMYDAALLTDAKFWQGLTEVLKDVD